MFVLRETGDWDIFLKKIWHTPQIKTWYTKNWWIKFIIFKKNMLMNSGVLQSGARRLREAPPLAARPVPWNGRGRRLVELTNGC